MAQPSLSRVSAQAWANLGRHRPNLGKDRPSLAESGRRLAELVRFEPKLGPLLPVWPICRFGPNLTKLGPNSTKCWPIRPTSWVELCRNLLKHSPYRPKYGPDRSIWADFGPRLSGQLVDNCSTTLGQLRRSTGSLQATSGKAWRMIDRQLSRNFLLCHSRILHGRRHRKAYTCGFAPPPNYDKYSPCKIADDAKDCTMLAKHQGDLVQAGERGWDTAIVAMWWRWARHVAGGTNGGERTRSNHV